MSELPKDLVDAMSWDFSRLQTKIITYNLDKEEAMDELCQYLTSKYQKEEKTIKIGLGEMARPINKKMLFFSNSEEHTYVRLRHSARRGRIEDQDAIPLTFKLLDGDVNKITIKIRSSTSRFAAIKGCENHSTKFKTRVSSSLIPASHNNQINLLFRDSSMWNIAAYTPKLKTTKIIRISEELQNSISLAILNSMIKNRFSSRSASIVRANA